MLEILLMVILGLIFAPAFFFTLVEIIDDCYSKIGGIAVLVIGGILSLCLWATISIVVPLALFGAGLNEVGPIVKTETVSVNIKSVGTEKYTNGQFFLGSGVIDSKAHYFSYYEIEKNKYARLCVPADGVVIAEEAESADQASYRYKKVYTKQPWWLGFHEGSWVEDREFAVPKGTIITQFDFK